MSDNSRNAVRSFLRRCWPVLAAVPLGAACGGAYALAAPVQYQANAYVMVVPQVSGDSATAVNFAQAYGRVIAQPEILQSASASTGVPMAKLAPLVQAVTSPDAPMVQITGSAPTATRAAKEANAVAGSLVAFGNAASKQTRVGLITFAAAARPAAPSSPSRTLDVAVGAAAGVLVGGLGMMARQSRAGGGPAPLPQPRSDGGADSGAEAAPVDTLPADAPDPAPAPAGTPEPAPAPVPVGAADDVDADPSRQSAARARR
ncbi:Wzz/FepE/Etk N-terminal domain-containing protein [Streptacidiphilus carbonis]|uniref:Wzz/FepE/Etk N-terminal domain-containing protein n=1 Tax=Streptacidiphilus carbonis TaxID=105422 RepID=UPI000693AE98|nr:Wzz/FepE/Etk N-terminal domain-containing protein [Streptacidiphilus carbonis]